MNFLNNPTPLWIGSVLLIIILLFLWSRYNSFVTGRNKVKTDFADIDVQLKRRASLIDNLVTIVREYAKHEEETFTKVAKARSAIENAQGPKEEAEGNNMLTSTLKSIMAISEAYPELKASENYQKLSDELEQTENSIATYRETYNQTVLNYNTMLQTFPNLLAASIFGFKEEELFEPQPQDTVDVNLSSENKL